MKSKYRVKTRKNKSHRHRTQKLRKNKKSVRRKKGGDTKNKNFTKVQCAPKKNNEMHEFSC